MSYDAWSEWSPLARGYALAWMRDKRATCSCGTRHDEWDPKQGGDREAYIADHIYCAGHAALALHQDNMPKDQDGRPMAGWMSVLRPREQWDAMHADDN